MKNIFKPRYKQEELIVQSVVTGIIELNRKYSTGIFKTVFKCESLTIPSGRVCIHWGQLNIKIGDTVEMKGNIIKNKDNEIFLVRSLKIRNRHEESRGA